MSESKIIQIRQELIERCDRLRQVGGYSRSEFMSLVLKIGMDKYEKVAQPVETWETTTSVSEVKIKQIGGYYG